MNEERQTEDCHDSAAPGGQEPPGCDAPEAWIACCDAPVNREPAKIDAPSLLDESTTPHEVLVGRIELQPPCAPPDLISETLFAQQHELGLFTLLSTFLL